jgi:DNA-binding transcriptional ArsR family regulator
MEEAYAFLAGLGQAMAHPTRLHILEALARREACVCHLTALLGQRQAHVSQHLRVLKDAGLVTDRREGQMVYYRRWPHGGGTQPAEGPFAQSRPNAGLPRAAGRTDTGMPLSALRSRTAPHLHAGRRVLLRSVTVACRTIKTHRTDRI